MMTAPDPWEVARLRLDAIGEAVRRARLNAGHTLRDVADRIDGLHAPYLMHVEHGFHVPTPGQAAQLREYVLQHALPSQLGPFGPRHHPDPTTPTPARSSDPDTSAAAADSVDPFRARATHWALLELLAEWGTIATKRHPDAEPLPIVPTHEGIGILYDLQRMTAFCDECNDTPDPTTWPRTCDHGWPLASPSGLRSRLAELVTAGWVHDTGTRATMTTGRRAIVWGLTDLGRHVWEEHRAEQ